MSKPVAIEESIKPLLDLVTKQAYKTRASWVNTRGFTVDPTFIKTRMPFLLDTRLDAHTSNSDRTGNIDKHI